MAGTYSLCILALLARVQVTLLGRYTFLAESKPDPMLDQEAADPTEVAAFDAARASLHLPEDIKRQYLFNQHYILRTGLQHLVNHVQRSIHSILDKYVTQIYDSGLCFWRTILK